MLLYRIRCVVTCTHARTHIEYKAIVVCVCASVCMFKLLVVRTQFQSTCTRNVHRILAFVYDSAEYFTKIENTCNLHMVVVFTPSRQISSPYQLAKGDLCKPVNPLRS